jgi:RHS repeat-associated protein
LTTYQFDAENHLTSASGNLGSSAYIYDGDGKRIGKAPISQPTQPNKIYWYGMGADPLDESDGQGNFTDEFVFFNGQRIARRNVASGNIYYYFSDHLGTSRVTVQDGQTAACYDADFYPFGGEAAVAANTCSPSHKFRGKERDMETGLDYFGARYHASSMGRFMSVDPSRLSVSLSDPQTWNRYAYARNNPLAYVDRNGKWSTRVHEEIIDDVFSGKLTSTDRAVLKQASIYVDKDQSPSGSYKHGMRSSLDEPLARAISWRVFHFSPPR